MNMDTSLVREYWHLVGHRRELLQHGDFVRFKTSVGDIVVFNDMGNIVAFDNKCAHRGALIYQDDYGNQANTCKYHGWSYSGGKLHIPNQDQFLGCNIGAASLNFYQVDWCGDFIFVGIEPKASLYDQLGSVSTDLENISFNIDARADFNRYKYECYWPIAVENALEPYHIDLIHPNTLAKLKLSAGENIFDGVNSVWRADVGSEKIKRQLSGIKKYFNIDYQYEGYMSIYLFPFSMISSTFGYSYSLQNFMPGIDSTPCTNFTSRLYTANRASATSPGLLDAFFESTSTVNRLVFDEDHQICKLMPKDSWSSEPLQYCSKSEEKIAHFRTSCRNSFERFQAQ